MKKVFLIIIAAVSFGFLFFGVFQYYVKLHSQKGALQVTSSPVSKVYLNGKFLGETPLCKCEAKDMLDAKEVTISLVPNDKNLSEFQEKITISQGVLTVIDRKFGRDSNSSGSVISLTPATNKKATELLVVSIPSKATIYLDNNQIGQTPLFLKNPTVSDHLLKASKEGYKDKIVRIRTPLGYKLTVSLYLSTDDSEKIASSSASAKSDLASASASLAKQSAKVTILETPTGFLRVRESNSLSSVEIARVSASEAYELVSEETGWFQIKLKDGKSGWISSQYATKQ